MIVGVAPSHLHPPPPANVGLLWSLPCECGCGSLTSESLFILSECGCGSGDSGCNACGCCRVCAEDKDRWDGMFQMEAEEADMFSALKERLKKRKEKIRDKIKKKEKKENLGLQLLFGG